MAERWIRPGGTNENTAWAKDAFVVNGVENGPRLAARPHRVAVDTQVRQAPGEAACLRVIASVQCLPGVADSAKRQFRYQRVQGAVVDDGLRLRRR